MREITLIYTEHRDGWIDQDGQKWKLDTTASQSETPAAVAGAAPCSAWTTWPTHTGQQFVSLGKEMWVGSVDVGRTDDDHGTKLTIWRGSGIYTIWSNHAHGFHFQQIAWPPMPNEKLRDRRADNP